MGPLHTKPVTSQTLESQRTLVIDMGAEEVSGLGTKPALAETWSGLDVESAGALLALLWQRVHSEGNRVILTWEAFVSAYASTVRSLEVPHAVGTAQVPAVPCRRGSDAARRGAGTDRTLDRGQVV